MGLILADTTVWIRHSQRPNPRLAEYLETPEILMHPLVLGELACGMFSRRRWRFGVWRTLPRASVYEHDHIIDWIESERLMGRGIGFIDAHLLYSTLRRPGTKLWTHDKRLEGLAEAFGVAHPSDE